MTMEMDCYQETWILPAPPVLSILIDVKMGFLSGYSHDI
jgi:hypothetical protein